MASETDRIEKEVFLKAPLDRAWRAVSDAREFGTWFGVEFDGAFVASSRLTGRIRPTKVDPEVAKLQELHAGKAFAFFIERVEPMRLFSFQWHPNAVDPGVNYSSEPMTLVTFELKKAPGGTLLTVTESGFDRIALARRAQAFQANEAGWEHQGRLIEKYLARVT